MPGTQSHSASLSVISISWSFDLVLAYLPAGRNRLSASGMALWHASKLDYPSWTVAMWHGPVLRHHVRDRVSGSRLICTTCMISSCAAKFVGDAADCLLDHGAILTVMPGNAAVSATASRPESRTWPRSRMSSCAKAVLKRNCLPRISVSAQARLRSNESIGGRLDLPFDRQGPPASPDEAKYNGQSGALPGTLIARTSRFHRDGRSS